MKILFRQFLSRNHSWGHVGHGLATSFIKMGHEVHLFSTDGGKLPEHLQPHLIGYTDDAGTEVHGSFPDDAYDCQVSYTAMKNFPMYFSPKTKNRFGIFCYEWSGKNSLPDGFAKHYRAVDKLVPPSQYAFDVFAQSGIPNSAMKVIPHGINSEQYRGTSKIDLRTDKKFKILANVAQNHQRKNFPGLFEAYGKAFTKNDDVCLILKGKEKPKKFSFDVSLNECLANFKKKFPNHAEIKFFNDYLDDMSALYRSVDAAYTMTKCEGFWMVGPEALGSGKMCIAPNYGGQLDFLNDGNSLLISGKEERAPGTALYWEAKHQQIWFNPSTDDAAEKLQFAAKNFETINAKIEKEEREKILERYSWDHVAGEFLEMCQ